MKRACLGVVPFVAAIAVCATLSRAQPTFRDAFDDLTAWRVIASDGVKASIAPAEGPDGRCLRLDYDFEAGSGYCIVRRDLDLPLPEHYRFSFQVRGEGPSNNFEFKLVDPSGDNVWWVNQRNFRWPAAWKPVTYKARHFQFAWGPRGPVPFEHLGAIEIAVAASTGGKGSVYLDSLELTPTPASSPIPGSVVAAASSKDGALATDGARAVGWSARSDDLTPWINLDLGSVCEIGGVVLQWDPAVGAIDYDVMLSDDGIRWTTAQQVRGSNAGLDVVPLPEANARHVRVQRAPWTKGGTFGVRSFEVMPVEFSSSENRLTFEIASRSRRGLYPRHYANRQSFWTVVGVPDDEHEALLNTDGAVEIAKGGCSVEPFIVSDGGLITWADVSLTHRLERGYLPIPTTTWTAAELTLSVTAFADGQAGSSSVFVRYTIGSRSRHTQQGELVLAVRPFQVLPPWQELNLTGGFSPIESLRIDRSRAVINDTSTVHALTRPDWAAATSYWSGDIAERLTPEMRGEWSAKVEDPTGRASGAWSYHFKLAPNEQRSVWIEIPMHLEPLAAGLAGDQDALPSAMESKRRSVAERWDRELNRVELRLPGSAQILGDVYRSQLAYVLINRDGPGIQPGSRTYERSWIRDGAMTSAALLGAGHADKVRQYVEWYARYLYPNGKVPCVVDRRGPDPVPEHDSHGEFINAVCTYFKFTRDTALLEALYPKVVAAVGYIESIRATRMTDEFRQGPTEKRVLYGLVPESISHEGYSAKPMHSYWDGFWVIRGLKDATELATVLGKADDAARFAKLRDEYRESMYGSMKLAVQTKGIDYIPGCAELGDFDATSTAIGVWPGGELGQIPEPQLHRTFEKYLEYFRARRDGTAEWKDYTPYEVRLIGTFLRLGERERAHELANYFLRDMHPPAWNHWQEVVHRDRGAPRFVGDSPHTWVGSDFMNAVRAMFVDERESDASLILGAGILDEWARAPEGIAVRRFPSTVGAVSYTMKRDQGRLMIFVECAGSPPPGGILVRIPDAERASRVRSADQAELTLRGGYVRLDAVPARLVVDYAK